MFLLIYSKIIRPVPNWTDSYLLLFIRDFEQRLKFYKITALIFLMPYVRPLL